MIPGEIIVSKGEIELNANRPTVRLLVGNQGDRPIQVGSHYHFYEANEALEFNREQAKGMRLDIPAGTAVRFEPGDEREVQLVSFAGSREVYGFNGKINGKINDTLSLYLFIKEKLEKSFPEGYKDLWKTAYTNLFEQGNWILNSGSTKEHESRVIGVFEESIKKATKSLDIFILGAMSNEFSDKIKEHLSFLKDKNNFVLRIFSGVVPSSHSDFQDLSSKTFQEAKIVLYDIWGGVWNSSNSNNVWNSSTSASNSNNKEPRVLNSLPSNIKFIVGAGLLDWSFSIDRTPFNLGWDHCKIIVIDGQETIFGGMNFISHSLNAAKNEKETREDTVHDLALRMRGGVAINAQAFINAHWERLRNETVVDGNKNINEDFGINNKFNLVATNFKPKPKITGGYYFSLLNTNNIENAFTPFHTNFSSYLGGIYNNAMVRCITVGRRSGFEYGNEPSDIALIELISSAQRTLYISQQSLFYPYNTVENSWAAVIDAIVEVLKREVNVNILLSRPNDKNAGKDGGYSSASSLLVRKEILGRIVPPLEKTGENFLQVYNLKNKDGKPARNHAKAIIVDERAAYIGSQNLYPNIGEGRNSLGEAKLGEFGIIIFDENKVQYLVKSYWEPLWTQSK